MRERLLGDGSAPRKLRRKPAADQAGLAKVLGMLGQSRLANNLNQIAKAAHIGVLVVSPALIEELENACRDIRIMRDALLSALGFPPAGASS
jgi:phosphoglycerate dehydrogenase-like enzyme